MAAAETLQAGAIVALGLLDSRAAGDDSPSVRRCKFWRTANTGLSLPDNLSADQDVEERP